MDVRESVGACVGVSGRDTVFVSRQSKASAVARNLGLFREKAPRRRVQRKDNEAVMLCYVGLSLKGKKRRFHFRFSEEKAGIFLVKLNQRQGTSLE